MVEKKPPQPPPQLDVKALKVLEERIVQLNDKIELIENNILRVNKKQNVELKALHSSMLDSEQQVALIKKRVIEIVSDLKHFARKEELDTLQKYVDYWEPVNFVTRHEVDELLKR